MVIIMTIKIMTVAKVIIIPVSKKVYIFVAKYQT